MNFHIYLGRFIDDWTYIFSKIKIIIIFKTITMSIWIILNGLINSVIFATIEPLYHAFTPHETIFVKTFMRVFGLTPSSFTCMITLSHKSKWANKSINCKACSFKCFMNLKKTYCDIWCRNPSLGLVTKARACKGAGQEWSLRITFHALGVKECERVWGNEPPHSQMSSHFGSWSPYGLLNFKEWLQRSKPIWLKNFLYHWKVIRTWMSKMGSHDPFG
jgi:hypothetical protein